MVKSRFVQHGVIGQPHQIIMEMLEARNEGSLIDGSMHAFRWKMVFMVAMLSIVGLLYKFAIPSIWEVFAIFAVSYAIVMLTMWILDIINEKTAQKGIGSITVIMGLMTLFVALIGLF